MFKELKHKGIVVKVWQRHQSRFQTYDICNRETGRLLAVGSFNTEIEQLDDVLQAIKDRHFIYRTDFNEGNVFNKENYADADHRNRFEAGRGTYAGDGTAVSTRDVLPDSVRSSGTIPKRILAQPNC